MLHACGITAFVTPPPDRDSEASSSSASRLCATGSLKVVPEDFEVVEIDPSGQRTDADNYDFTAAATAACSRARLKQSEGGDGTSAGLQRPSTGEAGGDDDDARTREESTSAPRSFNEIQETLLEAAPQLQSMFGTAADMAQHAAIAFSQHELSLLVQDVLQSAQGTIPTASTADSVTSSTRFGPLWWRRSCALGQFRDKCERQLVHLLARRTYPHLRTSADVARSPPSTVNTHASPEPAVKEEEGSGACVVSCSPDLHFILFCATLGKEAATCIAHWAIAAQAARQERKVDEATRALLQLVKPAEAAATAASLPVSVRQGVCYASFDGLTAVMQRPVSNGAPPPSPPLQLLSDKDVRRHVHDVLRRYYPFLKCQVRDGQVVLRYTPRPLPPSATAEAAASVPGRRRPRDEEQHSSDAGPPSLPEAESRSYLHFIVKKRDLDTAEMRQLIAEYCGIADGAVCAAGMKDKRAVTTQRCSVPTNMVAASGAVASSPPGRSATAQSGLALLAASTAAAPVVLRWPADPQGSYAVILRASPSPRPVHLGELMGNFFTVRLRHLRWATAEEQTGWRRVAAAAAPTPPTLPTAELTGSEPAPLPAPAAASAEAEHADLREFLQHRFAQCVERGFVNYFGQQRFGETVARPDDHTGVHLFAGRWVAAVRSLYRSCPDVYDAFPERMESRFAPGNSRDAQVMTLALRQTYRMYFSEHALTREDVQASSALWTRVCEKAITEGVPYYLRSLWVHAGQSAFFNLTASFVVHGMQPCGGSPPTHAAASAAEDVSPDSHTSCGPRLPPLPYAVVANASLPLGGYQVNESVATPSSSLLSTSSSLSQEGDAALWQQWKAAAVQQALEQLGWTSAQAFEQRKVAGVPVPGSWRAVVVRPQEATLQWVDSDDVQQGEGEEEAEGGQPLPSLSLSFALPSSSYATVFLREVLGCDKWW